MNFKQLLMERIKALSGYVELSSSDRHIDFHCGSGEEKLKHRIVVHSHAPYAVWYVIAATDNRAVPEWITAVAVRKRLNQWQVKPGVTYEYEEEGKFSVQVLLSSLHIVREGILEQIARLIEDEVSLLRSVVGSLFGDLMKHVAEEEYRLIGDQDKEESTWKTLERRPIRESQPWLYQVDQLLEKHDYLAACRLATEGLLGDGHAI